MFEAYPPHFCLFTDNQPQSLGGDWLPPRRRRTAVPGTDRLIQGCDWLPVWIEPDRLVLGIIDHKPNRFAKRGDPFRKAVKHPPHETHGPLVASRSMRRRFSTPTIAATKNWAWHGALCENDGTRTEILELVCTLVGPLWRSPIRLSVAGRRIAQTCEIARRLWTGPY